MSITAPDYRYTEYSPSVPTTEFPAQFPVFDNSDLAVLHDGEYRVDFTVTATYVDGVSTDAKAVFSSGLVGRVIVVGRRAPRRTNEFSAGAPLPTRDQNLALNTVEAEVQELRRDVERAVLVDFGEDAPQLPSPVAGKVIGWNENGDGLENMTFVSPSENLPGVANTFLRRNGANDEFEAKTAEALFKGDFAVHTQHVRPEWYGAASSDGDANSLAWAAMIAELGGKRIKLTAGTHYLLRDVVFPAGVIFEGAQAFIELTEGLTGAGEIDIDFAADASVEELNIMIAGAAANDHFLRLGPRFQAGSVSVVSDGQRLKGGIITTGDEVRIYDALRSKNLDRPIAFNNAGNPVVYGSRIGSLEIESYVRGPSLTNVDEWYIGQYRMKGRSPNAAYTAGHNGFLLSGCQNWDLADGYIGNAGEHAFRVGSSDRPVRDGRMGFLTVEKSGGCGFKINPASAARSANIYCAGVRGIDVGELSVGAGDNKEVVRLSHCEKIRIGEVFADAKDEPDSGQYTMVLNDLTDLWVGTVGGNSASASIRFNKDSDVDGVTNLAGPVRGVIIENYNATINAFGSGIQVQMDGQEFGDVYIHAQGVKGWNTNYVTFSGTPTITGPVEFTGYVGGANAPIIAGAPADSRVRADLTWGPRRYRGQCSLLSTGYQGAQTVVPGALAAGDVQSNQFLFNNSGLTAGSGNNGGGIEWTRLGAVRRGAAVLLRQTGANQFNTGLTFLVGGNTTATDALTAGMTLDHNGNLTIVGAVAKASGTFKIDHPLAPGNKHLIHGFIEGPRYDLLYRGRVKLHQGRAIVDIDVASAMTRGTFAALTQMAEVISLSNRSGFARVRASEIVDGRFEVICEDDASTDEVAWMVMAERADPYIVHEDPYSDRATGRLIPEHDKPVDPG